MTSRTSLQPVLTWEQHLVAGLPLHPFVTMLLIAGVLFAFYVAAAYAFDLRILMWDYPGPLPIDPGAWTALVFSLLAGYSFVVTHVGMAKNADDVADLHSAMAGRTADELRQSWIDEMARRVRQSRGAAALGFALGLGFTLSTASVVLPDLSPERLFGEFLWFLLVAPLLWAQVGRAAFFTILGLRLVSRLARSGLEIDLLDLSPLAPFGRIGLRNAFGWIVGSTILSLLMLNVPLESLLTAYPGILWILLTAVAALVIPLRPVHQAIRRAKREHLARVNGEIHRDREALGSGETGSAEAATRLPGLIAYRGAIESVREWPLDTPTIGRFLLYLAIPLGSWLGGALVERLLGRALD